MLFISFNGLGSSSNNASPVDPEGPLVGRRAIDHALGNVLTEIDRVTRSSYVVQVVGPTQLRGVRR